MLSKEQLPYVLAGVVLMTLQPLLVTLSQNVQGKLDYNYIGSTLLTELGKIVISASLLLVHTDRKAIRLEPVEVLQYAIPAAVYFVNNNLTFLILTYVNPTTFQLLGQLKIVFTGLLFRFFLSRKLSAWQWLAIWQLTCGTATSHIPLCVTGDTAAERGSSFVGLVLSVISSILSACGGIYSEKLLKGKARESIHWQNIQLYTWGILFNAAGAVVNDPSVLDSRSMFAGYNFWACMVVLNNALNGLAISAILKYADNIARVYAHAAAMIVTMALSIMLFDQSPTPQLMIAVAMVGASLVQYNLPASYFTEVVRSEQLVRKISEDSRTCAPNKEKELDQGEKTELTQMEPKSSDD